MFYTFRSRATPILCVWSLLLFSVISQTSVADSHQNLFDAETEKLLEQIKVGITGANGDLKTGCIDFSITLSQMTLPDVMPEDIEPVPYHPEETGLWRIRYCFDGDRHFYDVMMRNKMELNGRSLGDWQERHLRYEMDMEARTLEFQELTDTGWKVHLIQRIPSRDFRLYYSPAWWIWPFWEADLTAVLHPNKVETVMQVQDAGTLAVHITTNETRGGAKLTTEIWVDTERTYRPTQVLEHYKTEMKIPPQGRLLYEVPPPETEKQYQLTRWTYQLEQFAPGIWYPSRITKEDSFTMTVADENLHPAAPSIFRKATLQVQRAVFNVPITKADLYIYPDK